MNVNTFVGVRTVRTKLRKNEEECKKEVQGEGKIKSIGDISLSRIRMNLFIICVT
jgi:hypothetical protein